MIFTTLLLCSLGTASDDTPSGKRDSTLRLYMTNGELYFKETLEDNSSISPELKNRIESDFPTKIIEMKEPFNIVDESELLQGGDFTILLEDPASLQLEFGSTEFWE